MRKISSHWFEYSCILFHPHYSRKSLLYQLTKYFLYIGFVSRTTAIHPSVFLECYLLSLSPHFLEFWIEWTNSTYLPCVARNVLGGWLLLFARSFIIYNGYPIWLVESGDSTHVDGHLHSPFSIFLVSFSCFASLFLLLQLTFFFSTTLLLH